MIKIFKVNDIDISFIPGTWALIETLEVFNVNPDEIADLFSKAHSHFKFITTFAHKSYEANCLKNGVIANYSNYDVCQWIDDNGGLTGELFTNFKDMTYLALGIKLSEESEASEDGTDKKKA